MAKTPEEVYCRMIEPQLDVIVYTIQQAQKEIEDLKMDLLRFRMMIVEMQKDVERVLKNVEICI
jgi:uncharacterized membrane protein